LATLFDGPPALALRLEISPNNFQPLWMIYENNLWGATIDLQL